VYLYDDERPPRVDLACCAGVGEQRSVHLDDFLASR
jgi:hypothetical protein